MATYYKAPTDNFESTTLNGAIDDSATTITLTDASNIQAPGVIVINRQDGSGNNTPSAREVVSFTGKSSNDLTGCTRGFDNSTARSHADGALVETMPVVGMWNDLRDGVAAALNTAGTGLHITGTASISTAVIGDITQFATTSVASISQVHLTGINMASAASISLILDEDDMSSDSVEALATQQSIKKYVDTYSGFSATSGGWYELVDPTDWTYNTTLATSEAYAAVDITVPSYSETFSVGDRVRVKQGGGWLYAHIVKLIDSTSIGLSGGKDYTIADAAFTQVQWSKLDKPAAFPRTFSYTPTWTGFASVPTADIFYQMHGSHVHVLANESSGTGTSNAAALDMTLPIKASTEGANYINQLIMVYDNNSWQNDPGAVGYTNNTITAKFGKTVSTVSGNAFAGFTTSNGKGWAGHFWYTVAN